MQPGIYHKLKVLRDRSVGLFLGNEEGEEVLLPIKYIPEGTDIGDELDVFVYLDHEDRPVATTKRPRLTLNEFAPLKVMAMTRFGSFMNWGMEKELLVPFREQQDEFDEGKSYVIQLLYDEESNRLYGTNRIDRQLSNEDLTVKVGDEISGLVYRQTDLGYLTIVNGTHKGLIYANEVFKPLRVGDRLTVYVKRINDDNKIDLSVQPIGFEKSNDVNVDAILTLLVQREGNLDLGDKSTPEEIQDKLKMSKKAFKRAIGSLYKERRIIISDHSIQLA